MAVHPVPLPIPAQPSREFEALTLQEKPGAGNSLDDDASCSPPRAVNDTSLDSDSVGHPSPSSAGSLIAEPGEADDSWITYFDMTILRTWMANHGAVISASTRDAPTMSNGSSACTFNPPLIRRLPKGTRIVKFVGEGTVNAVFEISTPADSPAKDCFSGKLLRVAKVSAPGQPSEYRYTFQQDFYYKVIKPMLGQYAVEQELVILHNSGIIDEINAYLKRIDHLRKPRFQGSSVGHSNWGFLVEDMRPGTGDTEILVEFKPKWLSQSPSAPPKAIRCRQCALELRRFMSSPASRPCPENKPCPLALGNPGASPQVRSPFRIADQLPGIAMADKHFEAALAKVMDHDVIHLLRSEQERLDQKGPLHANAKDKNLAWAMTIRDCTLFALIPVNKNHVKDNAAPKVRLCDFDWKDPQTKAERWSATENALIQGGFYTADWILCRSGGVDTYYHPPTLCTLEWKRPDRLSGLRRGLDIIILEEKVEETAASSADGQSVQSAEKKSSLETGSLLTVHTHVVDREMMKAVQEALRGFKKEPKGTPQEATYNPLRPFLI